MTADPDLQGWVAAYRDPCSADDRPVALLRPLHTLRHLPPTHRLARPWSEDIGDGWAFHFNGKAEAVLVRLDAKTGHAVPGRHLLVLRHGAPVLLIDHTGGWGQPALREAFIQRLAIFLETLKGEAA
jgi:hypothetical protein